MFWGPGEPSLGGETQVRAPWGPQVESLWLEVVRKCLESRPPELAPSDGGERLGVPGEQLLCISLWV